MKKSFSLILLSCFFALPAYAQTGQNSGQITAQSTNQTTQSTKTTTTKTTTEPVQVNVTINNSASAQGNTQTTTIDNTQNQTTTTAASAKENSGATISGSGSAFGDYASSPYHSNPQIGMLRNSVWNALVPRKKLYDDPAGKNAGRTYYGQSTTTKSKSQTAQTSKTKSSTTKGSKTKSSTAQTNKAKSTTAGSSSTSALTAAQKNTSNLTGIQANGLQNLNLDELKQKLASGQMILLEQKDGEICIPLEQFAQLKEQMSLQGIDLQTAPASGGVSGVNGISNGANSAVPYVPANSVGTAPAESSANPFSPANSVSPVNTANPAGSAAAQNSAVPTPPRTVTPLGGEGNDIFAIPSNPFEPADSASSINTASPANPAISGNTQNPSAGNPMARDPLVPQVSPQTQGNRNTTSQRDISVTQNMSGAQTVTTTANGQTAAAQTAAQTNQ